MGLVLVLSVLAMPVPHLVSPDWDVVVVDEHQNAIEGMTVRLLYQDYSLESGSHEETHTTDASGLTRFSAKRVASPIGSRILGALGLFVKTGVHASTGPYAYLVVYGKGRQGDYKNDTWTGQPSTKQSRIVTRPAPPSPRSASAQLGVQPLEMTQAEVGGSQRQPLV